MASASRSDLLRADLIEMAIAHISLHYQSDLLSTEVKHQTMFRATKISPEQLRRYPRFCTCL